MNNENAEKNSISTAESAVNNFHFGEDMVNKMKDDDLSDDLIIEKLKESYNDSLYIIKGLLEKQNYNILNFKFYELMFEYDTPPPAKTEKGSGQQKKSWAPLWIYMAGLAVIILSLTDGLLSTKFNYERGYDHGFGDGYGQGLDTMEQIIIRCKDNDSVGDITIWNKDTFHVFLTNKYVKGGKTK